MCNFKKIYQITAGKMHHRKSFHRISEHVSNRVHWTLVAQSRAAQGYPRGQGEIGRDADYRSAVVRNDQLRSCLLDNSQVL
jgi:hypothetical protein